MRTSTIVVSVLVGLAAAHSAMRSSDFVLERPWDYETHAVRYAAMEAAVAKTHAATAPARAALRRDALAPLRHHHASRKECTKCMGIATAIDTALKNTTDVDKVKDLLQDVCSLLGKKDDPMCDKVVDTVLHLANILAVKGWHWMLPNLVCADLLEYCIEPCCSTTNVPEQRMLSFASRNVTGAVSAYGITWVTLDNVTNPAVQYRHMAGPNVGTAHTGAANTTTYTYGGWRGTIYNARMDGLTPNTTYEYRVGSDDAVWSAWQAFTTLPSNAGTPERPLRIASVADMGYDPVSNHTVNRIQLLVDAGEIDFVTHSGDVGYADSDEPKWDVWGRKIEGITAKVPYMTTPGNHEMLWNFTVYRLRYQMPPAGDGVDDTRAMFYTFSVGPVSFVMMDSETEIDTPIVRPVQKQWAARQFARLNAEEQFILASFHRPLYCTEGKNGRFWAELLRGMIEPTLLEAQVPLVFVGHVHNYERSYPVAANIVFNTSYDNPKQPVYILNGAAGQNEGQDSIRKNESWAAATSTDIGFSTMVFSGTAGTAVQVNQKFIRALDGTVVDDFTLTKRWGV